MRVLFGMILGGALTVGVAFVSDTWSGGSGATPTTSASAESISPADHRNMVNWDVVAENARIVGRRAREAWSTLSHKVIG
jgi:hypothetical protein